MFLFFFNVATIKFYITNVVPIIFLFDSADLDGNLTRILKVEEVQSIGFGIHFEAEPTKLRRGVNVRNNKRREIILIPKLLASGTG